MKSIPYQIIAYFGHDYLRGNGKDEIRYRCPECINRKGTPDTKGHLYVNIYSFAYNCCRCGYSGYVGRNVKINESRNYDEERDQDAEELIKEFSSIDNENKFKLKIPIDKVTTSQTATEYLLNRGFTYNQMEYYDMRVGNLDAEFGRIIIPNEVNKKVYTDFYSARTYTGQIPKYHNSYDIKKSQVVFNLHRIKEGSPIIVVEGALTAVAAGFNAVATLGKTMSSFQASLIAKKKPSIVFVNYDYGAETNSFDACRLLSRYLEGTPIYQVLMKDERDAADLSHSEYAECLKNATRFIPLVEDIEEVLGLT